MSASAATLYDMKIGDVVDLADAAIDLLTMYRYLTWLLAKDGDDDRSCMDFQDRMEAILNRIGLPQPSYSEYIASLERMLKSRPIEVDYAKR